MKKILLLALLVMMLLATVPVQAMTVTMANPGGIAERDVLVYYPNGTLQGWYNSSSIITLDDSSSYIFALRPLNVGLLDDPSGFIQGAFAYVSTNIFGLAAIALIVGIFLSARR